MTVRLDLNSLEPNSDGANEYVRRSGIVKGSVEVIFNELEWSLLRFIRSHEHIVGCMAWLTNPAVLEALAERTTAIIVQKEDFLRPDFPGEEGPAWTIHLRKLYSALRSGPSRYGYPSVIGELSYCGDPTIDPVRCVGICEAGSTVGLPRMHHKFLVGCRLSHQGEDMAHAVVPLEVWTGSYNASRAASRSFENAVIIRDPDIAAAYLQEHGHITAFSEPLNWDSEWLEPEWRIGS